MNESVGQINIKIIKQPEIAPLKLNCINPPPGPTLVNFYQATLQSAANLLLRRAISRGFTHYLLHQPHVICTDSLSFGDLGMDWRYWRQGL